MQAASQDTATAPVSGVDAAVAAEPLEVEVDQELCTGDGLCVTYAPEVFEFDIDGLAYVKDAAGELQQAAGARIAVPANVALEVLNSAAGCPGECIHVTRAGTDDWVGGPRA